MNVETLQLIVSKQAKGLMPQVHKIETPNNHPKSQSKSPREPRPVPAFNHMQQAHQIIYRVQNL